MTLLTVINDVCAAVGVHQTNAVIANINENRTMFEMLAVANEMADRIAADTREWSILRKNTTSPAGVPLFQGNGVPVRATPSSAAIMTGSEAFDLPADYRRMLMSGNVWRSTNTITPMRFIPDTDEWLQRRSANYASPWGEWTIYGGQIHIFPIMQAAIVPFPWGNGAHYVPGNAAIDAVTNATWLNTFDHVSAATGTFAADRAANPSFWIAATAAPAVSARFSYLDRNCVIPAGGGLAERFTGDGDRFRLPERLLKLGMIFTWKQLKGSPYAEDMGTYQDALMTAMGTDSPSPIFIGRKTISGAITSASYPFEVPDGMTPI